MAVNNNAAALLLALSALVGEREVIVSRGQAVEIGGGFRIPDVCRQSGAKLVEVGTTNRTHALDYEGAVGDATAAILRVHASNFRIVGFTEQPTLAELQAVASAAGALLLDDIGSGCLLDTSRFGLGAGAKAAGEPGGGGGPGDVLRRQAAGRAAGGDYRGPGGAGGATETAPAGAGVAGGQDHHRRAGGDAAALPAGGSGVRDPRLAHDQRTGSSDARARGGVAAGVGGGRR